MFNTGITSTMLIFLTLIGVIMFYVWRGSQGKTQAIRKVPALAGIEESIGRSVEMNKPVHYYPASARLQMGDDTPQAIATFSIMRYTARLCAKNGARFLVSYMGPETAPLIEELVKSAYAIEGKSEQLNMNDIQYLPGGTIAAMSRISTEQPGASMDIGPIYWDSIDIGFTGRKVGAITIGGTARMLQLPYVVLTNDYVFIAEELFAAGAYVSEDPIQINTVVGQDIGKMLYLVLMVVGEIILAVGLPVLSWWKL